MMIVFWSLLKSNLGYYTFTYVYRRLIRQILCLWSNTTLEMYVKIKEEVLNDRCFIQVNKIQSPIVLTLDIYISLIPKYG